MAVGIFGTRVAVGAHEDNAGAPNAGSVYVYELDGATPAMPVARLILSAPVGGEGLGYSLAMDATAVVAGAPFHLAPAAPRRSAAHVFGLGPTLHIAPGTISWDAGPGYVLQYANGLAPTAWIDIPSAVSPMSQSFTNASRFYRLIKR